MMRPARGGGAARAGRAARGGGPAPRAFRRAVLLVVALACAAAAFSVWARPPAASPQLDGRALFAASCSACHGLEARGVAGKGPSLVGVGAAAADFYLETGRMPLSTPREEPQRGSPAFTGAERRALTAYIGSLGGPAVPTVTPGDPNAGFKAFRDHCAGCHAITGRGGVAPPGTAPALQQATATQIAEAVRVGPYLMPRFDEHEIDDAQLDDITGYVLSLRHPDDRGGWGIGNIGPIPEGLVAWLLAGTALLIVARLIGERT
jgi:ubiquinol-cytochrome c reductase cytochrome c subunit